MAIRTRNAFRTVIAEAVRAVQAAERQAGGRIGGGEAGAGYPPRAVTKRGTDGDGNTITIYAAMTEEDTTESDAWTA